MNIINTKEINDEIQYIKMFNFDNTVQIDFVIGFIKQFESDKNKMLFCDCHSYDEEGHRAYYRANSLDELREIYDESPNPYFEFSIDFGDRTTSAYAFSLVTNINSKYLIYEVDKKKLSEGKNQKYTNGRR